MTPAPEERATAQPGQVVVFRIPKVVAMAAATQAERELISLSAVCRRALARLVVVPLPGEAGAAQNAPAAFCESWRASGAVSKKCPHRLGGSGGGSAGWGVRYCEHPNAGTLDADRSLEGEKVRYSPKTEGGVRLILLI
jgi:hypothetical protein